MSSDFNSTLIRKARKAHRCEECWRTIEPGEEYERAAGSWAGDFFTNVACAHCATARRIVRDYDWDYSEIYYGGLAEWLGEIDGEPALYRLRIGVDRKWRRKDGALMELPGGSDG